MSKHEAKVVKIETILPHGNADALEIIKVWDYDCVVRKGEYKVGDLAVYIEPDTVVDTTLQEFSFLSKVDESGNPVGNKHRITAKRLRGIWSQGLLLPAPSGFKENDDCWEHFKLVRWEPELTKMCSGGGGNLGSSLACRPPEILPPEYDLENIKKLRKFISDDEEVIVTTKIHGTNSRFVFTDGKMYCGSRTQWKKKPGYHLRSPKTRFMKLVLWLLCFFFNNDAKRISDLILSSKFKFVKKIYGNLVLNVSENAWWKALEQNSWIETFCKNNPDVVLYGEVFGPSIQGANYHYGLSESRVGFLVFDVMENGKWVDNEVLHSSDPGCPECSPCNKYFDLPKVPVLYRGKFDIEVIEKLAEEKETLNNAGHVREGVVVKSVREKYVPFVGRFALKYVSNNYLGKNQ